MGLKMASRRKRLDPFVQIDGIDTQAVYVMTAGSVTKIGRSVRVGGRALGIQSGQEKEVCVYWAIRLATKDANAVERAIHKQLAGSKYHARGEWYYMAPAAARGLIEAEIRDRGVETYKDFSFGYGRD
jgi:hypothetical protein